MTTKDENRQKTYTTPEPERVTLIASRQFPPLPAFMNREGEEGRGGGATENEEINK